MYPQHFCNRACYVAWDKTYKGTDAMRAKMAARIVNGGFGPVSKIEDTVSEWLTSHGISHERQVAVRPFFAIDFVIGSTWLEVNGCYWHGCPDHFPEWNAHQTKRARRDRQLSTFCKNRGIPLVVIWEHDIRRKDFSPLAPLLEQQQPSLFGSLSDDKRIP